MLKIVYLGTPDFSVLPLKRLVETDGVKVIAAVCNHDKPVGRKKILTPPPVKVYAESVGIPVYQYDKIRVEGVDDMKNLAPDLMVTCAFGQILSQELLDIPRLGVYNIHASLLPKFRGASPIQHAILCGERQTGVTIMKTDIGIDTGDILLTEATDILEGETAGELFDRLSVIGASAIEKAVKLLIGGEYTLTPQDNDKATLTKMIKKEDGFIDFNDDAENIVNKIRAFNPSPIAHTLYKGEPLKIYKAQVTEGNGQAGKVLVSDKKLIIACKKGAVSLLAVQKSGGKQMEISEFLRGNKINVQEELGK